VICVSCYVVCCFLRIQLLLLTSGASSVTNSQRRICHINMNVPMHPKSPSLQLTDRGKSMYTQLKAYVLYVRTEAREEMTGGKDRRSPQKVLYLEF